MTAHKSSKYFFFVAVMYGASWSNLFVSVTCACIEDVLSFYNEDNACEFNRNLFKAALMNKEERCLLNCTIDWSNPSYEEMDQNEVYEIKRLTIKFSQTVVFDQEKFCPWPWYPNKKVVISISCGDRERNETCRYNQDCMSKLSNSTCNSTTGKCVCRENFLRKGNTCLKASMLGEKCSETEQCQEVNSFCHVVSGECKCRAGFTQHGSSCLPARKLGESCKDQRQCLVMNPNSSCTNETCQCLHGYLDVSNTCTPAVEINGSCSDSKQCQELNPNTTCNAKSDTCECQQGFIQHSNSCLPVRKLGEACEDPKQCSMTTNNSTCNRTKGECQCADGYIIVPNTCLPGHVIFDEICENYNQHSESDQQTRIMENIGCNSSFSPSRDTTNGEIGFIGVGLAGFLLGVCFGLGLFYICLRRQKKSSNSSVKNLEDNEIQMQKVKVSEGVNSRLIVSNKDIASCTPEDNGIYNHLRENPVELHGQEDVADYDHCPPQASTDDLYSHTTAGNDELQDYDGDYGKIN